jgi:membrane-associated phospholipid phosphatase
MMPHHLSLPDESAVPQKLRLRRAGRAGAMHVPSLLVGVGLFVALGVAFAFDADVALARDAPGDAEFVIGHYDLYWIGRLKRAADAHPENTPWIRAVTHLGNRTTLMAVALLGCAWQFCKGRRWLAAAWVIIAASGALLNEAVKRLAQRPRPSEIFEPIMNETSFSFPSGHAMGSLVGYGLIGYVMILQAKKWWQYVLPVIDVSVVVFAIGFSRMYLRVHWATDVVGGFLLGGAWLALSLGVLEAWRRGRGINIKPLPAAAPAGAPDPATRAP